MKSDVGRKRGNSEGSGAGSSGVGADWEGRAMSRTNVMERFQRLKGVGAGGQARVWKAKCVEDVPGVVNRGEIVALKIKDVQDDESDEQFKKLESRIAELKTLGHANVVRYLGCFRGRIEGQGCHVIVQEYLEGETLKERLSRRRLGLDVDEGLRIVRAAADGLEHAAEHKIFHRDVKPGNIFLCEDGTVKLIDFGVAKQEGETVDGSSNLRGTFDYMAPDFMAEAFSGDEQSDIFSLGVVLHEIISGKLPYLDGAGSDMRGWVSRWRQWTNDTGRSDSPIFVHAMTMRLLNGASAVLEKALEPNRSKRYAKFGEFRADLGKIAFYEQKHGDRTYRRLQFVGKGGFGEVFKARWVEENVDVAVKQLLNAEYAKRFRTEAKVMQELQDPCFVKFIDFFETSDHAFLVMRFLDGMPGSSLRDAINRYGKNGIPKNLVFPAFERYARGLSLMHKHKRQIIHRDIKPSNLYYPIGRPDLVAIMDFGIVKSEDNSVTQGMVPCTLDYAPPEIALTDSRGGPGMDIFALGLCMYEALTGSQGYPRVTAGTAGLMSWFERCKTLREPVFDDPRVTGDPELLAFLRKMTAPDLSRRFHDADEVAVEIRKLFYRKTEDDDCPPTQVFSPETDPTRPIDVERLMEWFREWGKDHPVEKEEDLVKWWREWARDHAEVGPSSGVRPKPKPSGRWKRFALIGLAAACVSAVSVFAALQIRHPGPELPTPVPAPQPPPDTTVVELKRQLFEQKFAALLADEPVADRRARLSDGMKLLEQARTDGLYEDEARWTALKGDLATASTAAVGKIKNGCGCDLTFDGSTLPVGEVRLFKFNDGKCGNRRMKIFGHDERTVPQDLDGRTIEVKKSDFVVSSVKVALPELESGVFCFFEDQQVSAELSLKPGDYLCEYRRRGYESQKLTFAVKLGRNGTLPTPKAWEMSSVDVSLPKLEKDVLAQVDGKEVQGTFKLRPGEYKVVYTRAGYDRQVREFVVQLATALTLPAPENWKLSRVKVTVPELPADVVCRIDGLECSSSVELLPGKHGCEYARRGYFPVTNSFEVVPAAPMTLIAPRRHEWRALPVENHPNPISPEIRKLLSEARFYFDDGDYELTVKKFHEAFVKGYRLNANDLNVFETAYKTRRDYLKSRIESLEKEEYRKKQNLRNIEEHREKLRQLGEWYRAVKQI